MATRKAGQAVAERATGTAVATRPEGLPLDIVSTTIRIPKIKKGEPLSAPVRNGQVAFLDIYTTTGQDDENPQLVVKSDPKTGSKDGESLRFHVLAVEQGRSEQVDDELISYTLQGGRWLSRDGEEAGPNSYATQTYTVCIPDVDPGRPYKVMFYRSSMGAASNINTALVNAVEAGKAPWELAFELTTEIRKNPKFTWGVFVAKSTQARDEDVATATELAEKVSHFLAAQPRPAAVDRPEI